MPRQKLTGAPFLSRYGISTVAGFAGLLAVAVGKRPAIAIGTVALLMGQIGVASLGIWVWVGFGRAGVRLPDQHSHS